MAGLSACRMSTETCTATEKVSEPTKVRDARRYQIALLVQACISRSPMTVMEIRNASETVPVQFVRYHAADTRSGICGGHLGAIEWVHPMCDDIRRELKRLEKSGSVTHFELGQAHLWAKR